MKWSTDAFMNDRQRWVFRKRNLFFLRKLRRLPVLNIAVHKRCNPLTISWIVIIEKNSAARNFLIETMMAENEKVVLKGTECVYQDDSEK